MSPQRTSRRQTFAGYLALFTSTGTLVCCALPSAIAALAGGGAVASLVSTFPWMVSLSRQKEWIFLAAGIMIVVSGILTLRPRGKIACSLTGGRGCQTAGRLTRIISWTSVLVFVVGALFAFGLLPILMQFDL